MTAPTPSPDPAVLVKALKRIKRDWAMHSNTKTCCDPFTVADAALKTYRALPSTPRVPDCLKPMTEEQLAAFVPLSDEQIAEALRRGTEEREAAMNPGRAPRVPRRARPSHPGGTMSDAETAWRKFDEERDRRVAAEVRLAEAVELLRRFVFDGCVCANFPNRECAICSEGRAFLASLTPTPTSPMEPHVTYSVKAPPENAGSVDMHGDGGPLPRVFVDGVERPELLTVEPGRRGDCMGTGKAPPVTSSATFFENAREYFYTPEKDRPPCPNCGGTGSSREP